MMRYSGLAMAAALTLTTLGATSPTEVIHPGDQLNVEVYGQQTLSQTITVLPDGNIEYPLVGNLHVGGITVDAATSLLASRLQKYVRHPYVTIAIAQLGKPSVLVLGNIKTPGKYELRSDARLTDAIAAGGGIAEANGNLPDARISDARGNVSTVSLQKLLHDGDATLDKPLAEGDVVYVPGPVVIDVVVNGAVDHPGDIQVAQGDRLSMAIAKAGNSASSNADLNHIRIERTGPDGKPQEYTVNLYQALEKGDITADMALQKGDVVYVPQSRQKTNTLDSPLLYILGRFFIP